MNIKEALPSKSVLEYWNKKGPPGTTRENPCRVGGETETPRITGLLVQ